MSGSKDHHTYEPDEASPLPLADQIGQLFMVGFRGTEPSPEIRRMIEQQRIGNIILFSRNVREPQQILDLTSALQECARAAGHRFPLLIAIDQENGMIQRIGRGSTVFPGNMALGATRSEQMTYDVALATGLELKALGINMNLAPSVDVNNNPTNPVIGVRSFSEDPALVARLGCAALDGYRQAGILATLKHFPGHGDTATDSHLALPIIPHDLDHLEATELMPFKAGIEAGAACVMTSHIYFPALMGNNVVPATIAPEIIQGLLRERLGFGGLVITDCLEMNAVYEMVGIRRGSVGAIQAGVDLVLISHHHERQQDGIEAVTTAIQTGKITSARLAEAVEHVINVKRRLLSWDTLPTPGGSVSDLVGGEAHRALRDRVYDRVVTLVRSDSALVPLHPAPNERLWVLAPEIGPSSQAEDRRPYPRAHLVNCLRHYHADTALLAPPQTDQNEKTIRAVLDATSAGDIIIALTVNAHRHREQAELVNRLQDAGRRVIGVAVAQPYDLLAYPTLATYLATYEYTEPALEAVARVLFGDVQASGTLPVSLPGLYTMG